MTADDRPASYRELLPKDFTLRDEANAIVACAFRNGPLERLHQGANSKLLEDPTLRRITGPEMKELMINACEQMEKILRERDSDPRCYVDFLLYFSEYCRDWER